MSLPLPYLRNGTNTLATLQVRRRSSQPQPTSLHGALHACMTRMVLDLKHSSFLCSSDSLGQARQPDGGRRCICANLHDWRIGPP